MIDDTRTYPCLDCAEHACDCGRSLQVERVEDGFVLTLIDPEIEFDEFVSMHGLSTRIAEAYLDEFMVYADDGIDQGGIFLSDEQLDNLTGWMDMPAEYRVAMAQAVQAGLWEE